MTEKKKKMAKVPNLRFPGFEVEWEVSKLGDLLEFKNGINASKEQYGKGIKFINVLDILENDFITYEKIIGHVDVSNDIVEKYAVNYGDILFQRSSETREEVGTASVYLDKEHTATFGGFVIRGKKIKEYDPVFLNKLLKTKAARDSITSKSGGSTRYNVGQETLSSVELSFPSTREQKKIADFLSLMDDKISTSIKIIQQLKTLMQGLRKKLLKQQIRFKDEHGRNFPDWEEKKLGNILVKHDEKTTRNNQYPVLTSARTGIYFQKDYFDGNEVASKDNTGYNIVPKGYFTYRHMSDDTTFKFNINTICEKGIVSTLYPVFTTIGLNDYFLKTYLNDGQDFKTYALMQKQGGSRTYMYFNKLTELVLAFPCLEEQNLISNFLSSINKKIEGEKEILERYENQKKYLLHNMFI